MHIPNRSFEGEPSREGGSREFIVRRVVPSERHGYVYIDNSFVIGSNTELGRVARCHV
jgi:hypothetical protein